MKYRCVVDGSMVYDPRTQTRVVSNNPALVLAHAAEQGYILTSWSFDEEFWDKISKLADYCEAPV